MNFNVNDEGYLQTNSSVRSINTRNIHHFHRQNAKISCARKVHALLASKFSVAYRVASQDLRIRRQNLK